jgi:hypothetical protein
MYLDTPEERYRSDPIEGRKDTDVLDTRNATVWVANLDNGDTVVHIDEGVFRHSVIVLSATGREELISALMDAEQDATGEPYGGTIVSKQSWTYELLGEQVMIHTTVVRYPLDGDDATG